jgi:hypothetical protein
MARRWLAVATRKHVVVSVALMDSLCCIAWKAAVVTTGMGRAEALVNRVLVHAFSRTSSTPIALVAREVTVGVEVHAVRHVPGSDASIWTVAESWTILEVADRFATAAVVAGGGAWVVAAVRLAEICIRDQACDCTERKHRYSCKRQRPDHASARMFTALA